MSEQLDLRPHPTWARAELVGKAIVESELRVDLGGAVVHHQLRARRQAPFLFLGVATTSRRTPRKDQSDARLAHSVGRSVDRSVGRSVRTQGKVRRVVGGYTHTMRFGVPGLGILDSRDFRAQASGFGCRVWGIRFRIWGSGFRVQGLGG